MFANDISRKLIVKLKPIVFPTIFRCDITTTRKAYYNRNSGSLSTTYFVNKMLRKLQPN